MFKKCNYCKNFFKGEGYFCSDFCEIKNHSSEVFTYGKKNIVPEIKEKSVEIKTDIGLPVLGQNNTEENTTKKSAIHDKFDTIKDSRTFLL